MTYVCPTTAALSRTIFLIIYVTKVTDSTKANGDRPVFSEVEKALCRVLCSGEDAGDLYSETAEKILDVIFRQDVQWFVENKAKRNA